MGAYLIATPEPLRIDEEAFRTYFDAPAVRDDLSLYMAEAMDGPSVLSLLVLDEEEARKYAENSVVMTDDLPLIEFPLFRVHPSDNRMRAELLYEFKSKSAADSQR